MVRLSGLCQPLDFTGCASFLQHGSGAGTSFKVACKSGSIKRVFGGELEVSPIVSVWAAGKLLCPSYPASQLCTVQEALVIWLPTELNQHLDYRHDSGVGGLTRWPARV